MRLDYREAGGRQFKLLPDADSTTTYLTFTSEIQRERAVAYLAAERDGDTLSVSWQGVGRIGGGASAKHSRYFTGYRVTITDGTLSQQTTVTTEGYVANVGGYASPVTVEVVALNKYTGAGPVAQVVA